MNKDLEQRVAIAINTYIPQIIEDYLEDHQPSILAATKQNQIPEDVLNLAVTLKAWANPGSNYPKKLHPSEYINFKDLLNILENSKNILRNEKFTREDEDQIRKSVQVKLNSIADSLIEKYHLSAEINQTNINNETINQWWESKSDAERARIQHEFQQLSAKDKEYLHSRAKQHQTVTVVYGSPTPDLFWYFWMCNYYTYLPCHTSGHFTPFIFPYFHSGWHGGGHGGGHHGGGHGGCDMDGDSVKALGIVVAGAVLTGYIIAGTVAAAYSVKKAFNSIINFCSGDKMVRSLFRLAGIGAGGYGGFIGGMAFGASIGSIIPGLGTGVGAIIGGIFGGGIGAGVGALVTKYTAKLTSYLFNQDELNPTNPNKYKLTERQAHELKIHHIDLLEIDRMIVAVHREKQKIGISGSLPFTAERKQKNELNQLLTEIKTGTLKPGPIKIGNLYYDPAMQRFETDSKTSTNASTVSFINVFGADLIDQQQAKAISQTLPIPSAPLASEQIDLSPVPAPSLR